MNNRDKDFEGLLVASGVPVSDAERSELRRAYETLCNLADRVRNPERDWTVNQCLHLPRPHINESQRNSVVFPTNNCGCCPSFGCR